MFLLTMIALPFVLLWITGTWLAGIIAGIIDNLK